jgi:hypothetical protein
LAADLDEDRHPSQLGLGELIPGDGLAEDNTVGGVFRSGLIGGLHHP